MTEKIPKIPPKIIGWMKCSSLHGLFEIKISTTLKRAIKRWPEKFSKSRKCLSGVYRVIQYTKVIITARE